MVVPERVAQPLPLNAEDAERWRESELRHRMLTGGWQPDALDREADFFDVEVRAFLPAPEISRNPMLQVTSQVSVLYDDTPTVEADGAADLTPILPEELWPLCQERHFLTEGLNECLMRVDWPKEDPHLMVQVVPPSHVVAWAPPWRPDRPTRVEQLVRRKMPGVDKAEWTWEVWDVTDVKNPIFRIDAINDKGERTDVTEQYAGSTEYPYRDRAKQPIFPFVIWHKRVGNRLWSYNRNRELVIGTLTAAVLWTFWISGVRDGAHPQRVLLNGKARTGKVTTPAGTAAPGVEVVHMQPHAILQVDDVKDGKSASIDQWSPAMDPKTAGEALENFEAALATYAGLSPADIQRGSTGMSGYAIVVSRDGLRRAQRRQIPPATMGDRLLLATLARMSNAYSGRVGLPEDPAAYRITYAELARSPEEVKTEIEEETSLVDAGLRHPVDAFKTFNPGLSDEDAVKRMIDIERFKAMLKSAGAPKVEETDEVDPEGEPRSAPAAPVDAPNITLTSTDIAAIVTVDETRASIGLPPLGGEEGALTVSEYQARNAAVIAAAANATAGDATGKPGATP